MKKNISLAVFSIMLWTAAGQTTWYVSPSGDNNRNSGYLDWDDAFKDLQKAIDEADDGDEIWVATVTGGTLYTPTKGILGAGVLSGHETFYINKNITIYGGFVGNEIRLSDRPAGGKSILMGEIIGAENAVLDGCEIVINATKEDGEKKN